MSSKKLCCSSGKHAADWYCRNIETLPSCKVQIFAHIGPGTMATNDMEADYLDPGSEELRALLEALDTKEPAPTVDDLVTLAQQLNDEGFYDNALAVGRYLEGPFRVNDFSRLATAYEIQRTAYERRRLEGDAEAAEYAAKLNETMDYATGLRAAL